MRELFSGIPAQKRNRRLLMPVQAYIDDSQTDGEVLVFAGYLASFDQWEKFSVDWQELLDKPPRWERFKMAEIAGTKDEERWERAGWFYRVVERYAAAFVAVSVDINAFHAAVKKAGFPPHKTWDPYVFAHRALLDATIQHQHELGISEPVDFIFDKFGKKKLIEDGWEVFKATCRPSLRDRISKNDPRFESDDDFLPLQAADMLAWHAREHWLKHRSMTEGGPLLLSWKANRNPHGYVFDFGKKNLPEVIEKMRGRTAALLARRRMTVSVSFSADLSDPPKRRGGAQDGEV
jgi:hypothetical protein